ncbi:YoaK family protein [Sphingomonas sp. MMS12-HWE2-04]|uniref:YoaK family protein n=1 Tax=Sphingomonas sp. MMS12-HWE2-04 TaxID=3234199 RepID=UPI00384B5C86
MTKDANFDPRVPLLLLLSATTGLVDAASVLGLGKVFTANMTGNVVFLGFAVAGAPGFAWPPFVVAIASFLAGALLAGRVAKRHADRSERRWLMIAAVVETTLLWLAAAISLTFGVAAPAGLILFAIIALTGVAMGFRNATIRQLKIPDLTTTVLTLTLTGLVADSVAAGGTNPNARRRIGAVLAIFAGAAIGAVLILRFGLAAPLAVAGALVLFGTMAYFAYPFETPSH